MKHHILIDDRSKTGKGLLQIAEVLSKSTKGIVFIEDEDDSVLIKKIKRNRKGDLLSSAEKKAFLKELEAVAKE